MLNDYIDLSTQDSFCVDLMSKVAESIKTILHTENFDLYVSLLKQAFRDKEKEKMLRSLNIQMKKAHWFEIFKKSIKEKDIKTQKPMIIVKYIEAKARITLRCLLTDANKNGKIITYYVESFIQRIELVRSDIIAYKMTKEFENDISKCINNNKQGLIINNLITNTNEKNSYKDKLVKKKMTALKKKCNEESKYLILNKLYKEPYNNIKSRFMNYTSKQNQNNSLLINHSSKKRSLHMSQSSILTQSMSKTQLLSQSINSNSSKNHKMSLIYKPKKYYLMNNYKKTTSLQTYNENIKFKLLSFLTKNDLYYSR